MPLQTNRPRTTKELADSLDGPVRAACPCPEDAGTRMHRPLSESYRGALFVLMIVLCLGGCRNDHPSAPAERVLPDGAVSEAEKPVEVEESVQGNAERCHFGYQGSLSERIPDALRPLRQYLRPDEEDLLRRASWIADGTQVSVWTRAGAATSLRLLESLARIETLSQSGRLENAEAAHSLQEATLRLLVDWARDLGDATIQAGEEPLASDTSLWIPFFERNDGPHCILVRWPSGAIQEFAEILNETQTAVQLYRLNRSAFLARFETVIPSDFDRTSTGNFLETRPPSSRVIEEIVLRAKIEAGELDEGFLDSLQKCHTWVDACEGLFGSKHDPPPVFQELQNLTGWS